MCHWTNFKNGSIIVKDIDKGLVGGTFLWRTVYGQHAWKALHRKREAQCLVKSAGRDDDDNDDDDSSSSNNNKNNKCFMRSLSYSTKSLTWLRWFMMNIYAEAIINVLPFCNRLQCWSPRFVCVCVCVCVCVHKRSAFVREIYLKFVCLSH